MFYPIHLQPCYKDKNIIKLTKNYFISEKIYKTGLSLPSSYNLTLNEQKYIINVIKDYFKK